MLVAFTIFFYTAGVRHNMADTVPISSPVSEDLFFYTYSPGWKRLEEKGGRLHPEMDWMSCKKWRFVLRIRSSRVLLLYCLCLSCRLYICNSNLTSIFFIRVSICTPFRRPHDHLPPACTHIFLHTSVSTHNYRQSMRCCHVFNILKVLNSCAFPSSKLKGSVYYSTNMLKSINCIFVIPVIFLRNFTPKITDILYLLNDSTLYDYFFLTKSYYFDNL